MTYGCGMTLDSERPKKKLCIEAFFANPKALGLDSSPPIEFAYITNGAPDEQQIGYYSPVGDRHSLLEKFDKPGKILFDQLCKECGGDGCSKHDCPLRENYLAFDFTDNCPQGEECLVVDLTKENLKNSSSHIKFNLLGFALKKQRECRRDRKCYKFWKHVISGIMHA